MLLLFFCILFVLLNEINTTIFKVVNDSHGNQQHNKHYHINNFNQLSDDDRTEQHTEDISDYVHEENTEYEEPEYDDDYYDSEEDNETNNDNNFPGDLESSKAVGEDVAQNKIGGIVNKGGTTTNTDLKWFNKKPTNQPNENNTPQQHTVPTKPTSNIIVSKILAPNAPSSNSSLPNEAEIKNLSNILSRIKNIKENANHLNNEKIIYEDERFLLLKFKLTPLNDSDVKSVLNDGSEDIDRLERKLKNVKSKDSGLFDSSFFEEDDDSFFDDFEDYGEEKYPGNRISNYERASHSRNFQQYKDNNHKNIIPYNSKFGHENSNPFYNKEYKTGKGFWIGNNYYPYHGPGFPGHGPQRPFYHFDEDFSDEDSSDCSEEYEDEESDENDGKDPGILYGKPRPGIVVNPPTNGKDPGILNGNQGPGIVIISTNGKIPTGGTDQGILYGNQGPGIVITTTNGRVPTDRRDPTGGKYPGILYGNPIPSNTPTGGSDEGILYGKLPPDIYTPGKTPGNTTGNNTDVVLVVIAAQ